MPSRLRRLALVTGALALAPIHLLDNGILLRHHFTAGEHYAYHMMVSATSATTSSLTGASSVNVTSTVTSLVNYTVLRVLPNGNAQVRVQATHTKVSVSGNGHMTTQTVPDKPATTAILRADGGEQDIHAGGLSLVGTGQLPGHPVAPGASWTTTQVTTPPSSFNGLLHPFNTAAHNTFTGYARADGQRAAAIVSKSALNYVSDGMLQGAKVHLHLTGATTGQTLWSVAAGRPITIRQHVDMRMYMSMQQGATSVPIHLHMVSNVTMQPAGW